jgi:lipopolysaccharide export system permease protein
MRSVDRYIWREMLGPVLFGLLMFASLLLAGIVLKHIDQLMTRGVPAWVIAQILASYVPETLVTALPMAMLFGTLTAFGRLAADSELIALHASGLGIGRLIAPVAAAGLAASLAAFALDEAVVPRARRAGQRIIHNEVTLKKPLPKVAKNVFFDGSDHFRMFVREADRRTGNLRNVTLFELQKNGFPRVTEAREARLSPTEWRFGNGTMFTTRPDGSPEHFIHFREWTYPLAPTWGPKRGDDEFVTAGDDSLKKLNRTIRQRKAEGAPSFDVEVRYWWKLAFPLASLALALLAAPLASRAGRMAGSSALGVGLAIPLILAYYILFAICRAAAMTQQLPPLAIWIPDAIALFAAAVLLKRAARQG